MLYWFKWIGIIVFTGVGDARKFRQIPPDIVDYKYHFEN